MVRRYTKKPVKQLKWLLASPSVRAGLIVVVMALIGFWGIAALRAAAQAAMAEAEDGTLSGSINKTSASGASGANSQTVMFGGTPPSPTNVAALTGGDSIAVVWDMPAPNVKTVDIFRNSTKIGTVSIGSGVLRGDIQATHYIDKNVTRGTTYRYQVQATNAYGNTSALSPQISATHPATARTAAPNVAIDSSKTSDYTSFLQTNIVPEIKTWYPKIADALAYPDYTAYSGTITLMPDPTYDGAAYVGGGLPAGYIRFNPDYRSDGGMFIHEITHIVQGYDGNSSPAGFITESLAEWTRDWLYRERYKNTTNTLSTDLANDVYEGANVIEIGKAKYDPNFPHKINVAVRKGSYNANYIPSLTGGKSAAQLLDEVRGAFYGNNGAITGIGGKCVDVASGNSADQTKLQLYTCNNQNPQKWRIVWKDSGVNAGYNGATKSRFYIMNSSLGVVNGKCIDVQYSGTTSGTIVWLYGCSTGDFNPAQLWTFGLNGTIMNQSSGLCLSTTNNGSEDGNQLIVATCNGSAGQKWTTPSAP